MRIRRIIDISRRISSKMHIWPGDEVVKVTQQASLKHGDECNLSYIKMGLHAGTHVDSPFHFINNGICIEDLDLTKFIGFVKVFELDVKEVITEENVKSLDLNEGDVVFFKTLNSRIPIDSEFNREFVYIDATAAKYLAEKGVKTVGIDYLSVDSFDSQDYMAHHILLSENIGIIEGLYLRDAEPGIYFFSCLPLKIEGVEGAPARAVLIEFE